MHEHTAENITNIGQAGPPGKLCRYECELLDKSFLAAPQRYLEDKNHDIDGNKGIIHKWNYSCRNLVSERDHLYVLLI